MRPTRNGLVACTDTCVADVHRCSCVHYTQLQENKSNLVFSNQFAAPWNASISVRRCRRAGVRKNERFAGRAYALQEPDGPPAGPRFGDLACLMLAATLRGEPPCRRELAAERFPLADASAIS